MTTQQVAQRYHELAQLGKNDQIISELYSENLVSIEPENNSNVPLITNGLEEYRKKEKQFFEQIKDFHGGFCTEPIIASFHFSCAMEMDVTYKGAGRKTKKEIGIFEVREGKIIREQWFYDDFEQ